MRVSQDYPLQLLLFHSNGDGIIVIAHSLPRFTIDFAFCFPGGHFMMTLSTTGSRTKHAMLPAITGKGGQVVRRWQQQYDSNFSSSSSSSSSSSAGPVMRLSLWPLVIDHTATVLGA